MGSPLAIYGGYRLYKNGKIETRYESVRYKSGSQRINLQNNGDKLIRGGSNVPEELVQYKGKTMIDSGEGAQDALKAIRKNMGRNIGSVIYGEDSFISFRNRANPENKRQTLASIYSQTSDQDSLMELGAVAGRSQTSDQDSLMELGAVAGRSQISDQDSLMDLSAVGGRKRLTEFPDKKMDEGFNFDGRSNNQNKSGKKLFTRDEARSRLATIKKERLKILNALDEMDKPGASTRGIGHFMKEVEALTSIENTLLDEYPGLRTSRLSIISKDSVDELGYLVEDKYRCKRNSIGCSHNKVRYDKAKKRTNIRAKIRREMGLSNARVLKKNGWD